MADKVIGAKLTVDGSQATQSVGNFKKELRDAQKEVIGLSEKFGATSKEAIAAAQKVAKLKDAIGDAKALSDAFNPDAKFNAFAGAIQGAVSGFSALQGAQALFGSESEELNKILLKVQAAMALSQGLNGILAAKDAFVNLGAVIKTNVVSAFSTLKGAIISTGIGALVVAVGLLIEKFSSLSDAADEAAEAQKRLNEEQKKYAEVGLKGELDSISRQEKLAVARAKLNGATEEQIFQIQQDYRKKRLESQSRYYDEIKNVDQGAAKQTLSDIKNGIIDGQVAEADNQLKLRKIREDAALKEKERRQKELQELRDFINSVRDEAFKVPGIIEEINKDFASETTKVLADQVQGTKDKLQEDADNRQAINQRITEQRRSAFDEMAAIEEQERLTKLETYGVLANAAETFAGIIGKQTAAGKALAIAGALINTYKGASEVIGAKTTLPEPFGTIQKIASVASIIATGIKQVKAITAVKVPGGGGGGGSVPSAPSVQTLRPTNAKTTLDQGSINQIGNAAGRAFVLETDVTNNQERIRRLNRAARIS